MTAAAVVRVGGLAVALGIGAAVASAAPAWAAPDSESGTTSQASASDSKPTKRTGQSARRSLTKAGDDASSAKVVSSTDRTEVTSLPAAAATPVLTRVAAPRRPAAAAPAQAVEATPTETVTAEADRPLAVGKSAVSAAAPGIESNPIHDFLATIFPWYDPRGQRITVLKGWQYSLPPQYAFFVNQVSGHATFTEDSAYNVNGVDQYDWLKLTGITFTPWRPDTDAIMVAWRYNLDTEMFEIGPYYNSDLARIMPTEDQIISVPANEEFDFSLDYDGITLTYGDQTVYKGLPDNLHPSIWTAVRINGWFGGTSPAPRTISYYLHLDCF